MCGDTFEYSYTLQRHLKEQHKDQLYSANSTGVTHRSTALQAKKKSSQHRTNTYNARLHV